MGVTSIDDELARASGTRWRRKDAMAFARALASRLPGSIISADDGVAGLTRRGRRRRGLRWPGTAWIQVVNGGLVCCIHERRRLVVISRALFEASPTGVVDADVVVLVVDSWSERSLSASPRRLRAAFPGRAFPDTLHGGAGNEFSAEDLWLATE